ncbi:MAG: RNA 2',3'-cyclic phosphodiesterase [Firmicutes bacterium]|nr:RNA 2',3'-cyclic phosphodiesterase [Bacillota bacterium]
MRLFIACNLSQAQKHELETIQHKMTNYLPGVRWVKPQGLHLTLSFLGDTDEKSIVPLHKVLEKVAVTANPFQLMLGGCGVFPSFSKARVLWIGIREGEEALQRIKKELDYCLEGLGFVTEKRYYKPHLTLGRMRYPLEEELIRRSLDEFGAFSSSTTEISKLVLYESRLTAHGAYYYPLVEAELKKIFE